MIFNNLKSAITRNLLNIPGWTTNRKILVIESDDWGSIRVSSKNAHNSLKDKGYPVSDCPYNSFDALESEEDLSCIFEVLDSVRDKNGKPARLTANYIMANPDFDKIKISGYSQYFYEFSSETYKRYPKHRDSLQIFKQGIDAGVVIPQFHGREHLNVKRWMRSLQENRQSSMDAFMLQMFSVSQPFDPANKNEFMDEFDIDIPEDTNYIEKVVEDGLNIFKQEWGFPSLSFIAGCYIWQSSLEKVLANKGVKYIQGMVFQNEPIIRYGKHKYDRKYHYQGQKNNLSQYYLIRNVFFEPTQNLKFDWISDCLKRIETAFLWHKPAIISSHRVNFAGFIEPSNRDKNLRLFKQLLIEVIKKWPEVEFMSSDQLGDLITKSGK